MEPGLASTWPRSTSSRLVPRSVTLEERGMTATLFLGQHVHLSLELGVRGDGTGLGQHLAALHFLTLGAEIGNPGRTGYDGHPLPWSARTPQPRTWCAG